MALDNPIILFHEWFEEAMRLDIKEPTAVTLATATKEGVPSARIVLLKHFDERGFCFYTNLTSRKGRELIENPAASLCFYWMPLGKQVRIEGMVERVTEKEADQYFSSRKRGSQIGAWASKQSLPMLHEHDLSERVLAITEQFANNPIPRPPFWSGFRLVPQVIEFWQEGKYRLHTRIRYTRQRREWHLERLYP